MSIGDTGPRRIIPLYGDGERAAGGLVQPVTGNEPRPCRHCTSFEDDKRKLVEYLRARKITVHDSGLFTTPIAREAGYKPMTLSIFTYGWCRQLACPTDEQATCDRFNLRLDRASLYRR